ncbi:MAG: hypothetical protein PHE83_18310, partial [Opitutaceae bacterium]|nr:hypothetical protein [Opitutaceae bacterium]
MIQLFIGRCLESMADSGLAPWFAEAARSAWRDPRPTVVLVPNQVYANRVRAQLAAREIPALNVRFWTLPELRRHLAKAAGKPEPIEDQEDWLLILRAAARAASRADPGNRAAAAVAAAPSALQETAELLEAGGWGRDQMESVALRAVLAERDRIVENMGRQNPAVFVFSLEPKRVQGALAGLLIAGFDAAHFGDFPTLRLAAEAADHAVVLLHTPRQKAEALEFAWLASWEALGPIIPVAEDNPAGLPGLADAFEDLPLASAGQPEIESARVTLAQCATVAEEADAVCALAALALNEGAETIGLIVPAPGYLAAEISRRLDHLGLPYYDALPPRADEARTGARWARLLDLFADQTVPRLLSLLAEPEGVTRAPFAADGMRDEITRAVVPFLFTDCALFAAHLQEQDDPRLKEIGRWMSQLTAPAEAPAADFLAALAGMAEAIGWGHAAAQIRRLAADKRDLAPLIVSRQGFRAWAEPFLRGGEKRRSPQGGHPYARLQLIRPELANGLAWDRLILCGQTEGVWPPPFRTCPYLGDDALRLLNEQVCDLNGRALTPGGTDEPRGVRPGRSLCLSPAARRALCLRDCANWIELAGGLAVTAARRDAANAGAVLYPGEIFTRLQQLLRRPDEEVDRCRVTLPEAARRMPANTDGIEAMLHAWQERRDPLAAFGEYEFCLKSPPDWQPMIPASGWEGVLGNPANTFCRAYLGVTAERPIAEELPWKMVAGIWVHHWISRTVGPSPRRISEIESWSEVIARQGLEQRAGLERLLAAQGRGLPAWWTSLHEQALGMGRKFAASLEAARECAFAQSEVVL